MSFVKKFGCTIREREREREGQNNQPIFVTNRKRQRRKNPGPLHYRKSTQGQIYLGRRVHDRLEVIVQPLTSRSDLYLQNRSKKEINSHSDTYTNRNQMPPTDPMTQLNSGSSCHRPRFQKAISLGNVVGSSILMDDNKRIDTLVGVAVEKKNGLLLQHPIPIGTYKDATLFQPSNASPLTTNPRNRPLSSSSDTQQQQSILLHRSCCFDLTEDKKTRHNRKISLQEMLDQYRTPSEWMTESTKDPAKKALPPPPPPQETIPRRFRSARKDAAATTDQFQSAVTENDSKIQNHHAILSRPSPTLGMSSLFRSMKKLSFDPNHDTTEQEGQKPQQTDRTDASKSKMQKRSQMHNSWTSFSHKDVMAVTTNDAIKHDDDDAHGVQSNSTNMISKSAGKVVYNASVVRQNFRFQKRQKPDGQRSWNAICKARPHILRTTLDHVEKFGASVNFGDLMTFIQEQQPENADDSDNASMNPEELFREDDEEGIDDDDNDDDSDYDEGLPSNTKSVPNISNKKQQEDSNCSLHLSASMVTNDEMENPVTHGRTRKFYSRRRSARSLVEKQKNAQRPFEALRGPNEKCAGNLNILHDKRSNDERRREHDGQNDNEVLHQSSCGRENEKDGTCDTAETEDLFGAETKEESIRTGTRAGNRTKKQGNGNILSRRNGQIRTKRSISLSSQENRKFSKLHQSWSGEFW